ncbi:MAG: hypothetical protein ACRDRI_05495 [Pseudonocardiaceae bacterium]
MVDGEFYPDWETVYRDNVERTNRDQDPHTVSAMSGAVVLTVTGGEVISHIGGTPAPVAVAQDPHALRFVQISDSHLGFTGSANTDVTGSFNRAVNQVNALGFRTPWRSATSGWHQPCSRGVGELLH